MARAVSLRILILSAALAVLPATSRADIIPPRCAAQEYWDERMDMCMPAPDGASGTRLSGQFNVFAVFSDLQGPRAVDQFAAPDMFMIDAGRAVGAQQFINLDLMGTLERWTYPWHGYPQLLQIGEEHTDGAPYIDAQHPHSSPVMGLTLSDTVSIGASDRLTLSFAPRGESTDGPIAYMHRRSARDDPDAPLGHHVGQDVGHISSTVIGARLDLARWSVEASGFNGTEPQPERVDLPLGRLDSEALRLGYHLAPGHQILASYAHLEQTDPDYPRAATVKRWSASLYDHFEPAMIGAVDHTFVIGSIRHSPGYERLTSFLDEAVLHRGASDLWDRIEILQRLPSELDIPAAPTFAGAHAARWVSAATIGYTRWLPWAARIEMGLGSSLTVDAIPEAWASAYGHRAPLTIRLILQLRGAGSWESARAR